MADKGEKETGARLIWSDGEFELLRDQRNWILQPAGKREDTRFFQTLEGTLEFLTRNRLRIAILKAVPVLDLKVLVGPVREAVAELRGIGEQIQLAAKVEAFK